MDYLRIFLIKQMKMRYLLLLSTVMLLGSESQSDTHVFIEKLERENTISYEKIINTRGAYIPPMCYTKTKDTPRGLVSNPCYSCHTKGKIPNYVNDAALQMAYSFPKEMMKNPYSNLFKDLSKKVAKIDNKSIMKYVRESNYFNAKGEIALAEVLPKTWKGYRPDCYYAFDEEGFDRDEEGKYTGWRAFRYYPFLGTFWPTNGSADDVLIRLDNCFRVDAHKRSSNKIYRLNLAIVEALVKQKEIVYDYTINENMYGVDVNADGKIAYANTISPKIRSYVGLAKIYLKEKKIHLAPGLFPEGTEFLHSVRYLDWDEKQEEVQLSQRMKELRYAKKQGWKSYGQLKRVAYSELWEAQSLDSSEAKLSIFRGNYEEGLHNESGWVYQGFIEDKAGKLRPQTHEETLSCMGCHSYLGVTTDSSFSFVRKFEGDQKNKKMYGWHHWSQKGLSGIPELLVTYLHEGRQYEYSFYLKQNHSGNEFKTNDEVQNKFFESNGRVKEKMLDLLHKDISLLLEPSRSRILALNKAYKVLVEEQSYIYGKEVSIEMIDTVHKKIKEGQFTGIKRSIVKE